jgi:hypothetical protein
VGTTTVTPDQTTTYNLTAAYIDGTTQTAAITVTVEQPPYLIYGLLGLLAIAAAVIVIMMVRRPRASQPVPASGTRAGAATSTAATSTAGDAGPSTSVTEAPPAKLVMPDGSEMLLAGNTRTFGRPDFEKLLPGDRASFISRQHINVWYEDGKYYIEDRGSTNGTRINGSEIRGSGRQALVDGDVVELADKLSITFKI